MKRGGNGASSTHLVASGRGEGERSRVDVKEKEEEEEEGGGGEGLRRFSSLSKSIRVFWW